MGDSNTHPSLEVTGGMVFPTFPGKAQVFFHSQSKPELLKKKKKKVYRIGNIWHHMGWGQEANPDRRGLFTCWDKAVEL